MFKVFETLKKALFRFRGWFPTELPFGKERLLGYTQKVFWAYDIPDAPGFVEAFVTFIMHTDARVTSISSRALARRIHRARTNESAWHIVQDMKELQKQKPAGEDAPAKVTSLDEVRDAGISSPSA